jgi:hypothetical protein
MQAGLANVDSVMVGGRFLKRNCRLLAGDIENRKQELAESGRRIVAEIRLREQTG